MENPIRCKSKFGSSHEVASNRDPREMIVAGRRAGTEFGLQTARNTKIPSMKEGVFVSCPPKPLGEGWASRP